MLWLEQYLVTYPHTVLVVSHDRSFLDEVCTDMIQFKNLKLWYYKGNYSAFESQRAEAILVKQRQYDAQQVKVKHMQEFIDKFRYNAKRASLVQSRIKQLEKEELIELEDNEEDLNPFNFVFPDCGKLSNNIVIFEDVAFGYPAPEPGAAPPKLLFEKVTLSIMQTSRVALVGPNGCGKSTLLKLIQSKILPTEGRLQSVRDPDTQLASSIPCLSCMFLYFVYICQCRECKGISAAAHQCLHTASSRQL